jgi:hypothetical protein
VRCLFDICALDQTLRRTPLAIATLRGNVVAVKLLLSCGANADHADANGKAPRDQIAYLLLRKT